MILSLKDLAHARTDVVQRTIGGIARDLAVHVVREDGSTGTLSAAIAERLVGEGRELQRTFERDVKFAEQGQAKIWALRVLSWIGSVVTLGALPGLTKLFAPKSEFADSLSRYLFGNNVDEEKRAKFEQLLGKFHDLQESDVYAQCLRWAFFLDEVPDNLKDAEGSLARSLEIMEKWLDTTELSSYKALREAVCLDPLISRCKNPIETICQLKKKLKRNVPLGDNDAGGIIEEANSLKTRLEELDKKVCELDVSQKSGIDSSKIQEIGTDVWGISQSLRGLTREFERLGFDEFKDEEYEEYIKGNNEFIAETSHEISRLISELGMSD
jgi:hypothetical protein